MKPITIIIATILVGTGIFFYATRPVKIKNPGTINITETQSQTATVATENNSTIEKDTNSNKLSLTISGKKAGFHINEVLRGSPFTVFGENTDISGTVMIENMSTKPVFSFSNILVGSASFKTDSSQRDGAIARFILKAREGNAWIIFTPQKVTLDTPIVEGKEFSFSLPGTLSISGVSKPVTFAVTATLTNGKLSAKATANLKRSDFNLAIPNVPFVASVSDTFDIFADIMAEKL